MVSKLIDVTITSYAADNTVFRYFATRIEQMKNRQSHIFEWSGSVNFIQTQASTIQLVRFDYLFAWKQTRFYPYIGVGG